MSFDGQLNLKNITCLARSTLKRHTVCFYFIFLVECSEKISQYIIKDFLDQDLLGIKKSK